MLLHIGVLMVGVAGLLLALALSGIFVDKPEEPRLTDEEIMQFFAFKLEVALRRFDEAKTIKEVEAASHEIIAAKIRIDNFVKEVAKK